MKKGQGEGSAFAFISFGVNPQMRGRELRWGVFIPVVCCQCFVSKSMMGDVDERGGQYGFWNIFFSALGCLGSCNGRIAIRTYGVRRIAILLIGFIFGGREG